MFSNSDAYQAEVRDRHQQLREDLARRQQAKQVKQAGRSRNHTARGAVRRRLRLTGTSTASM